MWAKFVEVRWAVYCAIYAVIILVVAHAAGLDNPLPAVAAYKTYCAKLNWSLYFLWFLILIPLLLWAGPWFFEAWEGLSKTGVLKKAGGGRIDEEQMTALRHFIAGRKKWILAGAVVLSLVANAADMKNIFKFYWGSQTISERMEMAESDPDFFIRWWFDGSTHAPAVKEALSNPYVFTPFNDKQTNVSAKNDVQPGMLNWWLFALIYIQQFLIGTMGIYLFLQMFNHAYLFARFNAIDFKYKGNMVIELNGDSPVQEFGLEHWNQKLNNIYWYLSVGLIIPIVSKLSQPAATTGDTGQLILKVSVSALLLAPMVATIISRQLHLPLAWKQLQSGAINPESFHQQRLWPMDRNWASKLGILLAFVVASTLLGSEYIKLLG